MGIISGKCDCTVCVMAGCEGEVVCMWGDSKEFLEARIAIHGGTCPATKGSSIPYPGPDRTRSESRLLS